MYRDIGTRSRICISRPKGINQDLDVALDREIEDHISDSKYATNSFLALLENAVEQDPLPQNDRIFLTEFLSWELGCLHALPLCGHRMFIDCKACLIHRLKTQDEDDRLYVGFIVQQSFVCKQRHRSFVRNLPLLRVLIEEIGCRGLQQQFE